jgi:peptidylprolyl isomerase
MPKSHSGDKISVKYTGWLYEDGAKSEQFDSNEAPGRVPFEFTLGKGVVLKGWDAGLVSYA